MTDTPETTVGRALDAMRLGETAAAEQLLQQAARQQPASALPHFLLAANFAQSGAVDSAEAAYLTCLALAPGFAMARFQLGLLQLTGGRPATARATWMLLGDSEAALQAFARGLLGIAAGDTAAGAESLRRGMALNPHNPALNRDMQGVLSRLAGSSDEPGPVIRATDLDAAAGHYLISGYRQGQ